jgi:hypothetical protein
VAQPKQRREGIGGEMKETVRQFWTYLVLLFKKWILWLFIVLDVIGAIVTLIFPQLNPPLPIYWGLALIGLFVAGFQVYLDLINQMPDLRARLEQVAHQAAEKFGYWCFWGEKLRGTDDQKLLFDWLVESGADAVSRNYTILCATISKLQEQGLKVEFILEPEFNELIRQHDDRSKFRTTAYS